MTNRKKLLWQLPFLVFLLVGTIIIIHKQQSTPYQHDEGKAFGTFYHITYQSDSTMHSSILAELKKVDDALSMFNNESVISKINRNESFLTNDMFDEVFLLAQKVAADTDGAFDITVAPLVNAWGFGFKTDALPNAHSVDSLLQLVDYRNVSLTKGRIAKKLPGIMLDCSAIAKGYGCDIVARLLERKGVRNYMVEIGGEVVAHGISEKRVPWKIGVTKPTDDSLNVEKELQTVLNVKNMAMATSGNYRNFYYRGGRKYAHTIDPHTGYPVQHNLLSATVLAKTCAEADAYATSFMVMGMEKAKALLERHSELMAYLIYIDAKGMLQVWFSPTLKDKIVK